MVLDDHNLPLKEVNIRGDIGGTFSDSTGFYVLKITANKETNITFSHIGYGKVTLKNLKLNLNETFEFNPVLKSDAIHMTGVSVVPRSENNVEDIGTISPRVVRDIPGANAGVENILKLLPGVASSNELSTQYNVRGGNFDENMVYINDIEVYRPFLIRSGQQEGLSFINPTMVSKIRFSAGGFQSKYGDRLSSVLDIRYKMPTSFGTRLDLSFLGASATVESVSKNKDFTNISGIRYRNNSLLVNSQQTATNFKPIFTDFQSYSTYRLSSSFHIDFLGHVAFNDYRNEPVSRQTNFGTLSNPQLLTVNYAGHESNRYTTILGGLKANYYVNEHTTLKFVSSLYKSLEEERSDVIAAYRLGLVHPFDEASTQEDPDNIFGEGSQFNQAKNNFDAFVFTIGHKGSYRKAGKRMEWGFTYTHEDINDEIREYELIDSTALNVRLYFPKITTTNFSDSSSAFPEISEAISAKNFISNDRLSGHIQFSEKQKWNSHTTYYNIGIRSQLWKINNQHAEAHTQFILSPRGQFAIKPDWKRDMVFRLATGLYQQPPFYRELRGPTGRVLPKVKAQKSYQLVLGHEYSFMWYKNPFTIIGEVFYKNLWHVNPYTLEDLRIRYGATNNATAYTYGTELRLNGAFVPGTESWLSIGFLRAKENINDRGYIARPTDQRFKLGILFQDYVPQYPNFKMYLNLVYNTGVPGGSPHHADPYRYQNRLRDYKRADLGISHIFVGENRRYPKNHWLYFLKELNSGIEIFNLFNNQNSITNTWVRDANENTQYAVPNFMTARVWNLKLMMRL
ncbi:TonB-dependent receptor plug domain-containing protein [Pareuzebyella sediminis]|uniref:TonB-dependent receptor plug domain-containing protein n=1 Tax=Pareuzebyella sediminis TaxID=2607998 RepID=UPI002938FC92|nr:TonB-dependent receptor plug domain-containing protein [Pareuzebyella sediminis]